MNGRHDGETGHEGEDATTTTASGSDATTSTTISPIPTDATPAPDGTTIAAPVFDVLGIRCEPVTRESHFGVGCRWTRPVRGDALYRLVRVEQGTPGAIVYRGDHNGFVDGAVEHGHSYLYLVVASSLDGTVVGVSAPSFVTAP